MPVPCKACSHPKRKELNKRLLAGDPEGQLSAEYGMSPSALRRHRLNHLSFSKRAASESQNVATIVGYADDLYGRALKVLDRAEEVLEADDASSRSVQAAATSLREVRASIELLAKLIVNEGPGDAQGSRDAALDAAIGHALAAITLPALGAGTGDIEDAELVP